MKFFVDTANVQELKQAAAWGMLDGVTTNPTLVAKEGRDFHEALREICGLTSGPVSAEVVGTTADAMVKEAQPLARIAGNVIIKVPLTPQGLSACQRLRKGGTQVNVTLCFSPLQALLAAKSGASYISPFVGRLDDIGQDGMELIRQIKLIYQNYRFQTQILVASIRHPIHVLQAAAIGADVVTMPFKVLEMIYQHPLTEIGIQKFAEDHRKIPQIQAIGTGRG